MAWTQTELDALRRGLCLGYLARQLRWLDPRIRVCRRPAEPHPHDRGRNGGRIEGGKSYARIRLSGRDGVEDIWRDIKAGIIRNVSVGDPGAAA